ncbi:CHAT domain-containing protein [Mesorhizobium sp. KR9-304]|uniref:CHAT domain-containing protein n=1 Tax=Mesorhizobium sp. KR9-304 TaxID=3156614 RepID=UPI0032B4E8AB
MRLAAGARLLWFVGLAVLAFADAATAAGLTPPRNQTFPTLEPALKPLRQAAYDHAVAGRRIEARAVLADMAQKIEASYGADSREMQDFYRDQAALLSIAGDGINALDSARKAVTLARKSSVGYVFFSGADPAISLDDQTAAFRDFVALADTHRNDVADQMALLDEAFRISQMAALGKASIAAFRKLQENRLQPGQERDLFNLAWTTSDRIYPLDYARNIVVRMGEDMAKAGLLTVKDVEVLNQDIATQEASIALLGEYMDGLKNVLLPEPLGIAEVKARLDADEAYVAFIAGNDAYLYVFCVTSRGFVFRNLDFASHGAEGLISRLRSAMNVANGRGAVTLKTEAAEPSKQVLETAWELYETLFFDIQSILSGKTHIWLSVDGELAKFPFEALVAQPPGPGTTFADAAWFVRRHAVTVLPTLALLGKPRTASPSRLRFLGIGNPDYRALASWDRRPRETRDIETLAPLPESASEAQGIGRALAAASTDILVGPAAHEARLQELSRSGELARYDIMLFATHGLLPREMEDAFEGGLALTPTRDFISPPSIWSAFVLNIETDGLLTSREIATLKLDADLVVLSACNTGAASPTDNEGYSGLTQAFLVAGARTMVVSHWPVVSDAAVEITTRMIAALKGAPSGKPLAFAHRQALLDVIATGGAQAHPRYWAPFSIFGGP